jgi:hypothetical protein
MLLRWRRGDEVPAGAPVMINTCALVPASAPDMSCMVR